ncbi:MAG: hypothetical protein V3575_01180 [Candidatus Absconditabacteria bacterium]
MLENIHLFVGEEQYGLNKKLSLWKKAFGEKYGKENIYVFHSNDLDVSGLINSVFGGGLFQDKKFIIVYGLPKDTNSSNKMRESTFAELEKKLVDHINKIPKDVILVFVSYSPDKRTKAYKFMLNHVNVSEFKPLSDKQAIEFVNNNLGKLTNNELSNYIFLKVGNNMYNLNNEITKLKTYCTEKNILILNKDLVDKIIYSGVEANNFEVLDNIFFNKIKAFELIDQIRLSDQDRFQFLGMLYWGLKIIIQIVDLYESGIRDSREIMGIMKVAPFVVSKNLKNIDKYIQVKDQLKTKFKDLVNLDTSIKTGKIPPEIFWLEIKRIFNK